MADLADAILRSWANRTEMERLESENARLRSCLWALVHRAGGKIELTMADAFEAPLEPQLIFHPAGLGVATQGHHRSGPRERSGRP